MVVFRMEMPELDAFAGWLHATGYRYTTVAQYLTTVQTLVSRLDVPDSTSVARRAYLDQYSPGSQRNLLAAYRAWLRYLTAERPEERARWPALDPGPPVPPPPVLREVARLYDLLGIRTLMRAQWRQVDLSAGTICDCISGVVTPQVLLARGDRVREACLVLRQWAMGTEKVLPMLPLIPSAPGGTRPVARKVLAEWRQAAEKVIQTDVQNERPILYTPPTPLGPLPDISPPPPVHIVANTPERLSEPAGGPLRPATDPESVRKARAALRGSLGREPSQGEVLAFLA